MEALATDTVCFLIIKAREFDAKVGVPDEDEEEASDGPDDEMRDVLEDHADDPVILEMRSVIEDLNADQQAELVALTWLGRDDYDEDDWPDVLQEARDAQHDNAADYLLGTPLLGDYLEEGLNVLGLSCEEFEMDHL